MDTTARRRKIQKTVVSDSLADLYPHDLNLYNEPPANTIVLSEFEDLAIERLQLLRIIEQASLKGHRLYSEDWRLCVKEDLSKAGLKKYVRLLSGVSSNSEQDLQARRADHISHFILRLAYCRSEELRRWFLAREVDWFRLRFFALSHEGIRNFLRINNLDYKPITKDELADIKGELLTATPGVTEVSIEVTEFYKLPFTDVCSLVRARKVFLKGGLAYVPTSNLVVSIQSKFRASLSESLNTYYHRMAYFEDDRINSLLTNLNNSYTGQSYSVRADVDSIDPANIDQYSKKHFPLCMRNLHEVFRSTHHLKHLSRLQYGLFLKGIGLLYEDAMAFWREEFTKSMDSNKFEKQYAYNIKHAYGKVGRMVSYAPYSCIKIILGSVGPGETHVCPFRHWDPVLLKQKLQEHGVNSEGVDKIKELVAGGHYQVACGKYFEATHGKPALTGINHPNQYFEESRNMEKDGKEGQSQVKSQPS